MSFYLAASEFVNIFCCMIPFPGTYVGLLIFIFKLIAFLLFVQSKIVDFVHNKFLDSFNELEGKSPYIMS